MTPISASHNRPADRSSSSNTTLRSKAERLMTLSTSAVAVCCSNDSRNSFSSRPFSMAMNDPKRRGCFRSFVQHYLEIKGRTADDLEHVGSRRLLLQRLAQFV